MNDDARPDRTGLNALMRKAEDGAEFAMRKLGRVPPTFLAATPSGLLTFIPSTMADERALARQLLDVMGLTEAVLRGTPFNN